MKTERNWTQIASVLNYEIKNYQALTKMIVQTMQRAYAYGIDPTNEELLYGKVNKDGKQRTQGLLSIKASVARRIEKILKEIPIWEEWLVNVPGIGPAIGGQLISLYYYKSIPICQECGADLEEFKCPMCKKEAKGQGVLKYRIELRDFPTISSWWHFMGRHVVDGKIPKRRAMKDDDEVNPNQWSSLGRKLGFDFKDSMNKQKPDHKYKAYALKRKAYREGTHPKATKGHRHNMAWNETWKLFLSHFWQVAHMLDGLEMTQPWCVQHGGHDASSVIPPYYFNGELEREEAA